MPRGNLRRRWVCARVPMLRLGMPRRWLGFHGEGVKLEKCKNLFFFSFFTFSSFFFFFLITKEGLHVVLFIFNFRICWLMEGR